MYNCWNEALGYLIKRCGAITIPGRVSARTYDKSNVKDEDQVIVRLLGQYHYGIQAKKDLYEVLISRGVVIN